MKALKIISKMSSVWRPMGKSSLHLEFQDFTFYSVFQKRNRFKKRNHCRITKLNNMSNNHICFNKITYFTMLKRLYNK